MACSPSPDGAGRNRRQRRYGRAEHGLARLVVIGSAGSVSLSALRWLADLGIGFLHLDRDGRLLTHSAEQGVDDPRLRRAQALAATTTSGLQVARHLLREKLKGQNDVSSGVASGLRTRGTGNGSFPSRETEAGPEHLSRLSSGVA
jgi:hypothetical protein